MSNYDINSNPALVRQLIDSEKESNEKYYAEHPDALTLQFEKELRELGYEFEVLSQTKQFMPKHKETILPIAIRYYKQATGNDKNFFLDFFHFRGLEEVVPMLLEDYYSSDIPDLTRWFITSCLYQIRSKIYVNDYLKIIQNPEYGINRQLIILLVAKLKVEEAIPIYVDLLEDESVRLHAISALGDYKREEFRPYFERFENDKHSGWRKYAKSALKKLGK